MRSPGEGCRSLAFALRLLSPQDTSQFDMPGDWEVRGLFGNQIAMEDAIDGLNKLKKVPEFKVLDRRNLQVVLAKSDTKSRDLVKNIIKISHGFVEADAPLGRYDKKKAEIKRKKMKEYEEKRKMVLQSKK